MPAIPIRTPRLLLRFFHVRDLDDLHAYHSDPEVTRYLYWEPASRAGTEEALRRKMALRSAEKDGEGLVLAIALRDNVIGEISLRCVSAEHQQAEIGFVVRPAFQGRGYAIEACRPVLELGFEEYGFHRICGRCDARNTASARLMERLGMRREAHLVENERFKGEWGSELIYAMLAREWRAGDGNGRTQETTA